MDPSYSTGNVQTGSSSTQMEVFFSAENLHGEPFAGSMAPYVAVYSGSSTNQAHWTQLPSIGRSEVLVGSSSKATWRVPIPMEYRFETRQVFTAVVFHCAGQRPAKGDLVVGCARFELGHVVAARRATLSVGLSPRGTLSMTAQESSASAAGRDTVELQFGGVSLKEMSVFGTDPYFKLFRRNPNGTRQALHTSTFISNTLNPTWPVIAALPVAAFITGNDTTKPVVEFECWDHGALGDTPMGYFAASFQDIMNAANSQLTHGPVSFELCHAGGKKKSYGRIHVKSARVTRIPTFPDFLAAGMQINVAVAIDFTASNGDPRNKESLHYTGGGADRPNDYAKAISRVCDVVLEYDSDRMIPVTGFGAKLRHGNAAGVQHYFHANMRPCADVHGLNGVMNAYESALKAVYLSGPTYFAPTIRAATEGAMEARDTTYTILLILTDGIITDTDATIDAIVAAGRAPLSIIIIGVGDADFSTMEVLDGDDERLVDSRGRPAARDLVQFVPFNRFARAATEALAAEVLEEVPRQVMEWAMLNNITPAHFHRPEVPAAVVPPPAPEKVLHVDVQAAPEVQRMPLPAPLGGIPCRQPNERLHRGQQRA